MNSLPGKIQISVLKTLEGEEELREQWNALVLQMEAPQVFFTYEWALAVERAFKSTIQPRIFAFSKHDKLIGIAALACQVSDPQRLFFLGASTGDYCNIVSSWNHREEVVVALLSELRKLRFRKVFFASIPEESNTLKLLAQSKNASYWSAKQPAYICRRIIFDPQKSSLTGTLNGEQRIRSEKLRRLSKLGKISLAHLSTFEEIASTLSPIIEAQIARFLSTNRLSPLLESARRQFLKELTGLLSVQHWMDICVLRLDDRDIAWNFGFRFEGVLFWYLPVFDTALESHRPGGGLLNLLVEEGQQDLQLKEIDLGLGDESYKEHFANAQRQTFNVHLSAGLVGHIKVLLRNAAAKAVKSFPGVERFVRAIFRRKSGIGKSLKAALLHRVITKIFSSDETIFFESTGIHNRKDTSCQLQALDWHNLATFALQNSDDPEMLEYLRQTAPRIRTAKKKNMQGFVVREDDPKDAQYFWVNDIPQTKDHESQSALIFDHFTPASIRGKRSYKSAIECVAAEIKKQGKTPWISINSTDKDTLHSLKTSSFIPRYATIRRKFIFSMPSEKKVFHPQTNP